MIFVDIMVIASHSFAAIAGFIAGDVHAGIGWGSAILWYIFYILCRNGTLSAMEDDTDEE